MCLLVREGAQFSLFAIKHIEVKHFFAIYGISKR